MLCTVFVVFVIESVCDVRCCAPSRTVSFFFFLMIRRPPRSTLDRSSAASDVYKRQAPVIAKRSASATTSRSSATGRSGGSARRQSCSRSVSYTHLRAHETVLDLVCRLLLEKKQQQHQQQDKEHDTMYQLSRPHTRMQPTQLST